MLQTRLLFLLFLCLPPYSPHGTPALLAGILLCECKGFCDNGSLMWKSVRKKPRVSESFSHFNLLNHPEYVGTDFHLPLIFPSARRPQNVSSVFTFLSVETLYALVCLSTLWLLRNQVGLVLFVQSSNLWSDDGRVSVTERNKHLKMIHSEGKKNLTVSVWDVVKLVCIILLLCSSLRQRVQSRIINGFSWSFFFFTWWLDDATLGYQPCRDLIPAEATKEERRTWRTFETIILRQLWRLFFYLITVKMSVDRFGSRHWMWRHRWVRILCVWCWLRNREAGWGL